ncbi:MAG TPA: TonB-dependent receptor plug domain-containing protein, partial [Paludibacter sp.]|nr:TonB-dependent receptor plug domain-containing protein [Paludibacter sp.]
MKNYKYISGMNRIAQSMKCICPILIFVFGLSAQAVKAVENESKPTVTRTISGLVRDAHTQKPVIAAQIKTLNGDASASTNESGVFRIKLAMKNAVLSVSAYDYNIRQYAVQGKDSVVIDLYADAYSNYSKSVDFINGAVDNILTTSSVKAVSNINHSTAVTADELLQTELGADARVVTRSGTSGIGSSVFIRGLNSINANAQPLFVVDGVVWNNLNDVISIHKGFFANPLDNIDVNDIESISVLKDGTSVYGSKAANGVVMIKTKRGSSTVTKINLNIVTGSVTAPTTIPVMNNDAYKTYVTDIIKSAGLTNAEIAQLPYLNDNPARSTYNKYHNSTNWNNEIYKTGISKNYSINVNGGDDKAKYYFTLGYLGNAGVVKTTDMTRYNMRLNADINMAPGVDFGVNVGFSRIDRVMADDGVDEYTSAPWLALTKSPFL